LIVIDASVALAWSLVDEFSDYADAVLERVTSEGAVVPAHWPLEVANALLVAERRGRIPSEAVDEIGRALADLNIDIRPIEVSTTFWDVLERAREYDLTVYDAAYLALALSRGVPLATLDDHLRAACAPAGVDVIS
jgi:predicted nucleic acid-binding protein